LKHAALPLLLALALPAALGGCRDEYAGTLSRERFVAVNVALRRLDAPGRDSLRTAADSARARAAVLKRLGVTEKELQAFVDTRRNDTEELSEAWREIAVRLASADSAARADSVRKDSLARAAKDTTRAGRDTIRKVQPPAPPPGGTSRAREP
jgi:methyl-accepting chemotaxis protein